MTSRDPLGYYALLGVAPSASPDEIKKAFRACAFECHPDRNRSAKATAEFQLINRAYQTLSTEASRKQYDSAYGEPASGEPATDPMPETSVTPPVPSKFSRGWFSKLGYSPAFLIVLVIALPFILRTALRYEPGPTPASISVSPTEVQAIPAEPLPSTPESRSGPVQIVRVWIDHHWRVIGYIGAGLISTIIRESQAGRRHRGVSSTVSD